jgi:hypothetical protein
MALAPGRLASGAVFGVVIGVPSVLALGSEGPQGVLYVGVALMVVLEAAWIASLVYLRTERDEPHASGIWPGGSNGAATTRGR